MCSGRTQQLLPQPHTHSHHHIPSTHHSQQMHVCVCGNGNSTVDETLWATLHREVRGQPDCILGHHSATYTADVLCCSLTAPTLSGSVFVGETPSWVCSLSCIQPSLLWVCYLFCFLLWLFPTLLINTLKYLRAVCRRSQKQSDVSGGRKNIQPQNNLRLRVNLQT